MIKTLLKFSFTLITFFTMLIFLTYRFVVTGQRNEDIYFNTINDFFSFWDINLEIIEKKKINN